MALQFCALSGKIDISDFEDIERSNLNRYLCAFVDDVSARNDQQLATYIGSNSKLEATALGEKYEDLVGKNSISISQYDNVVVGLDNVM
jgi:tRNA A37 threonylcarbamoyladenosine dehydratase